MDSSAIDLTCIGNATTPLAFLTCLNTYSGELFYNIGFLVLMIIIIGGYSLVNGVSKGFAIGGVFTSVIGILLFAGQYLGLVYLLMSLALMLIGIVFMVFEHFAKKN